MSHLITTAVTGKIHTKCGQPVLDGLAEGLHARVDLTPLNQAGEIHALLAGLQTYTLTRSGLVHRDSIRIPSPELTTAGPILAEHQCWRQTPTQHQQITTPSAGQPAHSDEPAY